MTKTEQLEIMKKYLLLKFELADWHGVSDAANDIREMEARPPEVEDIKYFRCGLCLNVFTVTMSRIGTNCPKCKQGYIIGG